MLGGVPEPRPELADLIVQMRPLQFIRQTLAWSLLQRKPWMHLALQSAALLLPAAIRARAMKAGKPIPWLDKDFAAQFKLSRRRFGSTERHAFGLPSRQECARTVVAMSRLMSQVSAYGSNIQDVRYPYLDQTLVEFVLSIPRNQIIRPGERRSLMRRALADLVPDEILSRRTKGTAARGPMLALANNWGELDQLLLSSQASRCGYVDQREFRNSVIAAKSGNAPQLVWLLQTLSLEFWLGNAARHNLIRSSMGTCHAKQDEWTVTNATEQSLRVGNT